MVSLGDERLCSQWEEQVVTELLTAEDRELWKKEIYIPTKGPTEISNSEWENWRTQGASALAYIDDDLRSVTWTGQPNKIFVSQVALVMEIFTAVGHLRRQWEGHFTPDFFFLFYLNEVLLDTFKLKVTQFVWLEFFKVVKLIKSEKTENLTVCRSLRPCNKTVFFEI